MKAIQYVLLFSLLLSCSTTFQNFFSSEESTEERNEKLMKEDFKVEEDVLNKFKETKVEEKNVAKKETSKQVQKTKTKPKTQVKASHKRKAIKPKPKKLIKKKQVPAKKVEVKEIKDEYPEGYPEKLKDHDMESSEFWTSFSPTLKDGEEVVLNISYMGVSTGKVTITTKSDTRLGETDVYHVNARVKTADFYSYLYEVDDYCDSYIRKDNFIPLKFSLIQRESSQDIDDLQLFDHTELKTYSFYKRVTKKKEKKSKKVKSIPKLFQDPLSVLYFIRGLPMVKGKAYNIPLVNQGKVEVLRAEFERKETINTEIGKKEAYRIKINTKHKGKTIKGGDMTFWFSADERRVFLKFAAKIKIGKISGEIESYKE